MEDMTGKILVVRETPPEQCVCIRCNRPVDPTDDVFVLKYLYYKDVNVTAAIRYLYRASQHLFPVIENGVRVCIGSPSNRQYIPGEPRDTRGLVDYEPSRESRMREALEQLKRVVVVMHESKQDVHPTAKGVM